MSYTAHSEFGKIKSLFIKQAKSAFICDEHLNDYWKKLNFLGKPDFVTAISEYNEFENILLKQVDELFYFPVDAQVNMDSIYCRDAAIPTDMGMVLCNMGKDARKNEPGSQKQSYLRYEIPMLGEITSPGTLEGGDVVWLDKNTLAVGHSYRSNLEGIYQLKNILSTLDVEIIKVDLPHYKGTDDVFHLMSVFSPVDAQMAVVYSPLMPVSFRQFLLSRNFQLIEVPDDEFESLGSNVLALDLRVCLMLEGNPKTKRALELAGCKVIEYKGTEISIKGGGGPTCLTRPLYRKLN